MSLRAVLGFTSLVSLVLTAGCGGGSTVLTPQPAADTFSISPNADSGQIADAKAFLQHGGVVTMVGGSIDAFNKIFGSKVPHIGRTPLVPGATSGQNNSNCSTPFTNPLLVEPRLIAVRLSKRHTLHVLGRFDQTGPGESNDVSVWKSADAAEDFGGPATSSWTQTMTWTTQNYNTLGDFVQHKLAVYRLNDDISTKDWYLLTSDLQDSVVANDGIDGRRSYMQAPVDANGQQLSEFDPASTLDGTSQSVTVGTSVSSNGAVSSSVSYKQTWSQKDVTTYVHVGFTQPYFTRWTEIFDGGPTATGAFYSPQAAIFQVAEGASIPLEAAEEAWFNNGGALCYEVLGLIAEPPVFSVSAGSLSIPGGSQAPLTVTSQIPSSNQGLPWTASVSPSNNFVLTQTSGVGSATFNVAVEPGTPSGSVGIVTLQTSPQYAAPSVETGGLTVTVNVP